MRHSGLSGGFARGLAGVALCAALLLPAAAEEREVPGSEAQAKLHIDPRRDGMAWFLDTVMDGASYSWRLAFPEGRTYDGVTLAVLGGGSGPRLVNATGRLEEAPAAVASELKAAADRARSRTDAPDSRARPLDVISKEGCYFMGYTALDFCYSSLAMKSAPARRLETSADHVDLALPSPLVLGDSGPIELLVLLHRQAPDAADCLLVATTAEYFEGEADFFASRPTYKTQPYVKKALALMSSTFDDDPKSRTAYRESALADFPGISMSEADWSIFRDDPDLQWQQRKLLTNFLNTMMTPWDREAWELVSPGMDGPGWFEGLYGRNRIPYVTSYVAYWFRFEAPLFMTEIESDHDYYANTPYISISEDEGAELARIAAAAAANPSKAPPAFSGRGMRNALGFLSAAILSSSFRSRIRDADGQELGAKGSSYTRLRRFDLEPLTLTLPALGVLRPGDLVLRYGASEQDADNPLMLAIVVSVPEKKPLPGSDPTEFLRGIIVCGGDQGTGLVSMARFLGDPPSGGYSRGLPFQLRRLLKVK